MKFTEIQNPFLPIKLTTIIVYCTKNTFTHHYFTYDICEAHFAYDIGLWKIIRYIDINLCICFQRFSFKTLHFLSQDSECCMHHLRAIQLHKWCDDNLRFRTKTFH